MPVSVGSPPSAEAMDRWLALGLSALSAEMTGAAEAGLRGAIEYSKNREAFGVRIGTFQALQHMAADAYVSCEGLRSTNNHASWAVDEEPALDALLAARVVKAYASRQMLGVAETAMQIYGGIPGSGAGRDDGFPRHPGRGGIPGRDASVAAGALPGAVPAHRAAHRRAPGGDR